MHTFKHAYILKLGRHCVDYNLAVACMHALNEVSFLNYLKLLTDRESALMDLPIETRLLMSNYHFKASFFISLEVFRVECLIEAHFNHSPSPFS